MKKVTARNKAIVVATLPKTAYRTFGQGCAKPGFVGVGLSSAHADDESIYEFCKAVLDHIDELKSISKVSAGITLQNACQGLVSGIRSTWGRPYSKKKASGKMGLGRRKKMSLRGGQD